MLWFGFIIFLNKVCGLVAYMESFFDRLSEHFILQYENHSVFKNSNAHQTMETCSLASRVFTGPFPVRFQWLHLPRLHSRAAETPTANAVVRPRRPKASWCYDTILPIIITFCFSSFSSYIQNNIYRCLICSSLRSRASRKPMSMNPNNPTVHSTI